MLDPHKYTLQLPATQAPRSALRQVIPYISFDPLGDVATLAAVEEGDSRVVCAELEALIQTRRSLGAAGRGMSPLDVALEYIDRGWAVVPVPFKSKRPVGDEWQNRLITEDTA